MVKEVLSELIFLSGNSIDYKSKMARSSSRQEVFWPGFVVPVEIVNGQFSRVMNVFYLLVGRKPKFKQRIKGWKELFGHPVDRLWGIVPLLMIAIRGRILFKQGRMMQSGLRQHGWTGCVLVGLKRPKTRTGLIGGIGPISLLTRFGSFRTSSELEPI
jgi:hypothetical protein